jgi:hypothetical protein
MLKSHFLLICTLFCNLCIIYASEDTFTQSFCDFLRCPFNQHNIHSLTVPSYHEWRTESDFDDLDKLIFFSNSTFPYMHKDIINETNQKNHYVKHSDYEKIRRKALKNFTEIKNHLTTEMNAIEYNPHKHCQFKNLANAKQRVYWYIQRVNSKNFKQDHVCPGIIISTAELRCALQWSWVR